MLSSIKIGIAPTRERMESLTIFAKSMHYKDGKRPTETTTWALKGPDLDKQYDAVMIQPGDIPGFTVQTVETMIAAMEDSQADAWIATCFSKRGHPLLLPTASIASVVNFEGESLRDWLRDPSRKVIEVETDDPGVLKDYDTPEDL
jgi:CTP:molybdopterin cytidylyltransferase MocA